MDFEHPQNAIAWFRQEPSAWNQATRFDPLLPHWNLTTRSAARYTCYAQRNGPTPPRLSICLGSKVQPDVTAINRSAARYTCYAQRNGPIPPRLSICLGSKVPA
jgi:hypothetical protein